MCIYVYTVSNKTLGPKLMSKYIGHGKAFPDTHRHFCPAIAISKVFPIVCGVYCSKRATFKNECLDLQPMDDVL